MKLPLFNPLGPPFLGEEKGEGGTPPNPRQHSAAPVSSFPRKRESMGRAERDPPPSDEVGDAHRRCLHTSVSTPLVPHSWGIVINAEGLRPSPRPCDEGQGDHCQAIPDRQTPGAIAILSTRIGGEHRQFLGWPAGTPRDQTDTIDLTGLRTSFGRRKPYEHKETGADHRQ